VPDTLSGLEHKVEKTIGTVDTIALEDQYIAQQEVTLRAMKLHVVLDVLQVNWLDVGEVESCPIDLD
jgi:hypothetical protein